MNSMNIDSFIPLLTMGAILIMALFVSGYIYHTQDLAVKSYRNYLWCLFLYILFKEIILTPKYTREPKMLYILGDLFIWCSYYVYTEFLRHAIDFKENKKIFRFLMYVARAFFIIGFISTSSLVYRDVISYQYYLWINLIVSLSVLAFFVTLLIHLLKRKDLYHHYLFLGSFCLISFTSFAIFFDGPQRTFFGFTYLSIVCMGYFLEILFYSFAISIRLKDFWETKNKVEKQNIENQKRILLQEIDHEKKILEEKEAERLKISVDLHDGINNSIAGLKYYINDRRLRASDKNEQFLLSDIELELNAIYSETKSYLHKLHTGFDEKKQSVSALLDETKKRYKSTGLEVVYEVDDQLTHKISYFQENNLYFIIKESISNAIKHSHCGMIKITITIKKEFCFFEIHDNGKGFNFAEKKTIGNGLFNLQLRMKKIDGNISFNTQNGTRICGKFPIGQ